ncbi:hypothetical protein, partial [Burkholderia ubonensis]|uniref:hypothetical protein n=1 Tax=Burkholderia ubonensis TaxID=101571 RepID=UPI001E42B34A
ALHEMKRIGDFRFDEVAIRPIRQIRPSGRAAVRSRSMERVVERSKMTRLRYRAFMMEFGP